ncbi:MAG: hypothetical protein K2K06_11505 [Oscillospiraceae bacterium]|nr:hypothetical protein [Oscillospiraceae bacterium]
MEETKIIITYDSKNQKVSVCQNNPDIETSIMMLCGHICQAIQCFMLNDMSFLESIAIAHKTIKIACDRIADELMAEEND